MSPFYGMDARQWMMKKSMRGYDSPLTDTGRAQVQHCAQDSLLRNIRYDRIISSTLLWSHETVKIIGQLLNVSIETDADWMELDNGPLAGYVRFIYIFTLSFKPKI